MPRRKPIPALLRTLHIPLSVGDRRPVWRRIVDYFPVSRRGLVQEVMEVGIVPPLSDAGGVGNQFEKPRGAEAIIPEVRDDRDVCMCDGLDNEHGERLQHRLVDNLQGAGSVGAGKRRKACERKVNQRDIRCVA